MYESPGGNAAGSDAELLNAIRSGHAGSYELLRARHAAAARSLAGHIALPSSAAGEAVEDAFSRVLDALRMGGGPTDAFRPYLLTAVRRAADDRADHDGMQGPADLDQMADPGQLEPAPGAGPDAGSAVAAYLSLPERWRAVLWHISIEGADPADAARLLGLPPEDADEVADQARDGFARAYLDQTDEDSAHADLADIDTLLRSTVAPVVLGDAAAAYLADGAGHPEGPGRPGPATISTATDPTGFRAIAVPAAPGTGKGKGKGKGKDTGRAGSFAAAPTMAGPATSRPVAAGPVAAGAVVAGAAAAGATAGGTAAAGTAAGGPTVAAPAPTVWSVVGDAGGATRGAGAAGAGASGAAAGAGAAGLLGAGPPLPADVSAGAAAGAGAGAGAGGTGLLASWQRSSPRHRRITAAVCALLAVGVVAGTLLALGAGPSPAPKAAGDPTAISAPTAAPSPAATAGQPKAKAKPPATARHRRHQAHHKHHAGPVTPPTQGPPSHSPAPHPRRHPVASVAAHVNVIGPVGNSHSAEVTFGVTATGARTRRLTAQITLPTGSALALGLGVAGGNGWTCSATGHGARCVHQPISAGSRASGGMYVVIMRTVACSRPVGITVTGGRAPSSVRSPRGFACVDPGRPGHHYQ